MSQAETLVQWAEKQLGTAEDPLGSNNIRYNTEYWGKPVSGDGYPWCMAFVWCGFHETGMSDLFYDGKKTARCTVLMNWAKEKGYFIESDYQRGDIFFFDWDGVTADAEHTGIYLGYKDGNRYVTIEGNINDRVGYAYQNPSNVIGAFRPQWTGSEPQKETVGITLQEIYKGMKGEQVRSMQLLLIGRGFSCGRAGADGDYGEDTRLALLRFQNRMGLDRDGVCGVNTWTRLLKG